VPQGRPLSVEEEGETGEDTNNTMSPIDGVIKGQEHNTNWLPFRQKTSKPPMSMKSVRLKIHFGDDTRFLMVPAKQDFLDFAEAVARKLGTKERLKFKTRDEEGDMITIADQEDLEVAISTCRESASKEGRELGKLEVNPSVHPNDPLLTCIRSGCKIPESTVTRIIQVSQVVTTILSKRTCGGSFS